MSAPIFGVDRAEPFEFMDLERAQGALDDLESQLQRAEQRERECESEIEDLEEEISVLQDYHAALEEKITVAQKRVWELEQLAMTDPDCGDENVPYGATLVPQVRGWWASTIGGSVA